MLYFIFFVLFLVCVCVCAPLISYVLVSVPLCFRLRSFVRHLYAVQPEANELTELQALKRTRCTRSICLSVSFPELHSHVSSFFFSIWNKGSVKEALIIGGNNQNTLTVQLKLQSFDTSTFAPALHKFEH